MLEYISTLLNDLLIVVRSCIDWWPSSDNLETVRVTLIWCLWDQDNTEVTAAHPDQVTCPGHNPTRDHWSPALTLWPIILSSGSGLALELQSSVDQGWWPGEENTAGVSQCGGCVSQSEVRTQSREFVSTNQRPAAAEQGPLLCRFRYMTIDSRTQFLI